jgi:hypothetical protein
MTIYRHPPKDGNGFRPGDVVWTPLRRRAVLTRFREQDLKWDAHYIAAIDGSETEATVLDPRFLTPA